jgi:hypothetical protein
MKNLKYQWTKIQYWNYHAQQNMIKDECYNLPRTKWLSNKVTVTCFQKLRKENYTTIVLKKYLIIIKVIHFKDCNILKT